jgi:hypothetical protein
MLKSIVWKRTHNHNHNQIKIIFKKKMKKRGTSTSTPYSTMEKYLLLWIFTLEFIHFRTFQPVNMIDYNTWLKKETGILYYFFLLNFNIDFWSYFYVETQEILYLFICRSYTWYDTLVLTICAILEIFIGIFRFFKSVQYMVVLSILCISMVNRA